MDSLNAPVAHRSPVQSTHFGDVCVDDYEWMRDKSSAKVIDHLKTENAYTENRTKHLKPLQDAIFNEIKSRTKETDMSVPTRHGDYWYFAKTLEGEDYALSCRFPVTDKSNWIPPKVESLTPEDYTVIFDANVEAKRLGADFFSLGSSDISEDGNFLLYAYDTRGNERYDLFIRDLRTHEDLDDKIFGISAGAMFDITGEYIFYTRADDAWRSYQVWRHHIGTPDDDVLVYEEVDEHFNVGVGSSLDKQYLIVESSSKTSDEVRFLRADNPTGDFEVFWKRAANVEYDMEIANIQGEKYTFVTHNKRSVDFDIDLNGQPFLVSGSSRHINGLTVYKDFILISVRENILIRVYLLKVSDFVVDPYNPSKYWKEIMPEGLELYSIGASGGEYESPVIMYTYSSYTRPPKLILHDVESGAETVLKEKEVLDAPEFGKFVEDDYHEERLWATADDGSQIPISLVYKGEQPVDRPCVIYGYGSYGNSEDPYFSIPRLSLLDRGVVWAVAHVRGGQEKGREWYESGKMMNKMNTFTDFIAASKHLLERGITSSDKLAANGGSAGGLLMGAILNLEPHLYAGIEADVPFVDPLTSILDPELPLTIPEWEEWGDPLHDENAYFYIKGYAPYNNVVKTGSSTKILATTSLNDTRVLYVEPAKWVAKLKKCGYDALLRCEMEAGHGGVSGRYKAWKQVAFEFSWLSSVVMQGRLG